MKIMQELEAMKKEIDEAENDNEKDDDLEKEEIKKEADTPIEDDKKDDGEEKEGEKSDDKQEEEKKADDAKPEKDEKELIIARERREKRALERKLQEAEDRARQLAEKPQIEEKEASAEVDPLLDRVLRQQLKADAMREFSRYETEFKRPDDYDDVALQYRARLYENLRFDNPRLPHEELLEMTAEALLVKASRYVEKGLNPAEELYADAKSMGYSKMKKEEEKESVPDEIKPDLKKVAANKARNAGTAGASGRGSNPDLTVAGAASLSPKEWSRLPRSERERILREANIRA